MKVKEELLRKILNIYILAGPFVDMLTSLAVRLGWGSVTMGVLVRFAFVGALILYVLFFYRGTHQWALRLAVLITSLYGLIYLGSTVSINGMGVMVENAKMFLKTYFFAYVLFGLFALYQEYRILVSDKLLTIVFCVYTSSIFLSAITNTSFPTYYFEEIGYCGWFYAGNEIGAIVAILASVTLLYGFSHPKYLWIGILGLLAFSSTYIGTKVPFLAIIAAAVLLFVLGMIKYIVKRGKKTRMKMVKYTLLLLCIFVLFQAGSPVRQNIEYSASDYQDSVVTPPETVPEEPVEPGEEPEEEPSQFYLVVNWLLKDRLGSVDHVFKRYENGSLMEKLFGIGYTFQINGKWHSDAVEMDFIAIYLKQGIIGMAVYLMPILYFAVVCICKLFRQLKRFWELEPAFVYTYAILMGLACAFLAGHVLVAPAVSVFIAICIVKLYAFLTEYEEKARLPQ